MTSGGRLRHHSNNLSRKFVGLKLLKFFLQRFWSLVACERRRISDYSWSLGEDGEQPKLRLCLKAGLRQGILYE